jgi:hypothetical protein
MHVFIINFGSDLYNVADSGSPYKEILENTNSLGLSISSVAQFLIPCKIITFCRYNACLQVWDNAMDTSMGRTKDPRPVQPNQILHDHFGNCGELQDLFNAGARTV